MFEQFLHDIVAEHVGHQLQRVRLDFTEDLFFLVAVGSLQLLLNKPRTVLITTEFDNMVVDILREVRDKNPTIDRWRYKPSAHNACSPCCSL